MRTGFAQADFSGNQNTNFFSAGCFFACRGLFVVGFSCVVGFSGKIIDPLNLKMRRKIHTNTLLIHGDQDDIVSPTHLLEAKDFFLRENIDLCFMFPNKK